VSEGYILQRLLIPLRREIKELIISAFIIINPKTREKDEDSHECV